MFLVNELEFNTNTYTSKSRREFEMYLFLRMVRNKCDKKPAEHSSLEYD